MMMAFWMTVGFICFATRASAEEPKPCLTPSRYMGSVTMTLALGNLYRHDYDYDAIKQRLHTKMFHNDEFVCEDLFLFKQRVHYSFKNDHCSKLPHDSDFKPFGVPKNATFLSQVVLGTLSTPGHGLVVNNWKNSNTGLLSTFTDADCLPVSQVMEDAERGVFITNSFFNNLLVYRSDAFVIPETCKHANLEPEKHAELQEIEDGNNYFLSFFQNQ
ncbi:mammalian ependymin-related protein 1-like [Engraulis encrasicolus]|uniref:mammalian ependymin-related protein 1-like n=1 Tax=Engraulis encrasicolus TaxID=184585 RepID=UPI002FD1BE0C